MRSSVNSSTPLRRRKLDILFILFFLVNLTFVTYMVDIEQNIIPDPYHFTYPVWPPAPMVDAIHWYGQNIDPVLMARPVWWRMTIWIDTLFFGPYYAFAIYAFIRGREWIRIPSIIWGSMLITNVIIILGEELAGPHATPHFPLVLALNLPWLLVPMLVIYRVSKSAHPFAESVPVKVWQPAATAASASVDAGAWSSPPSRDADAA